MVPLICQFTLLPWEARSHKAYSVVSWQLLFFFVFLFSSIELTESVYVKFWIYDPDNDRWQGFLPTKQIQNSTTFLLIWIWIFGIVLKEKIHSDARIRQDWVWYLRESLYLMPKLVFIRLQDGVFPSLKCLQITKSILWNFAVIRVLPFLNSPKDLDSIL